MNRKKWEWGTEERREGKNWMINSIIPSSFFYEIELSIIIFFFFFFLRRCCWMFATFIWCRKKKNSLRFDLSRFFYSLSMDCRRSDWIRMKTSAALQQREKERERERRRKKSWRKKRLPSDRSFKPSQTDTGNQRWIRPKEFKMSKFTDGDDDDDDSSRFQGKSSWR